MMEKIEDLKYFLEEVMEMDFKNVTSEQRENLQKEYNRGMSFKYNIDNLIFVMDEYTWKNFMYYLGMEYESDNIGVGITASKGIIRADWGRVCCLSCKGRGDNHRGGAVCGCHGAIPSKGRGGSIRSAYLQ